jgi:hypothetical protein
MRRASMLVRAEAALFSAALKELKTDPAKRVDEHARWASPATLRAERRAEHAPGSGVPPLRARRQVDPAVISAVKSPA